jgi:hypothetical protein
LDTANPESFGILEREFSAMADDYDSRDDIDWFRDELRHRDQRIVELKQEIDELRDLNRRLGEHAEDYDATLESWQEAFGMMLNENGQWTWEPFWKENWELVDKYNDLVKRWNRNVADFNVQDVGRPLAASEAQVAAVTKLHKAGKSLRAIVDETSLSLRTVRTIVGRKQGARPHQQGAARADRDRQDPAGALEESEANRRRATEASRQRDRDRQRLGDGSQGAGARTVEQVKKLNLIR